MMKYLSGSSCCILAVVSMFLLSIPVEASPVLPAFSDCPEIEQFQQEDLRTQERDKIYVTQNAVATGNPSGELKEKRLKDLLMGASTGTAWPIAPGYVVTNSHVVSESNKAILINIEGREIPAWTVLRDQANDIVLLEVNDPHALPPALPLAQSQTRLGASVFTIGFPRVDLMGRTPKLSAGVISGEYGLADDPESFQTTVSIQPGNSGGPLLNMKGEVVGVVRSMLGIRDVANGSLQMLQTTSCALKIKDVRELLSRLPSKDPHIHVLPSLSDDLETLASRIKDSVLLVISK
jgi:S1-C subfamily serine protease